MFDSIGRRGRSKNLSGFRWIVSSLLSSALLGVGSVVLSAFKPPVLPPLSNDPEPVTVWRVYPAKESPKIVPTATTKPQRSSTKPIPKLTKTPSRTEISEPAPPLLELVSSDVVNEPQPEASGPNPADTLMADGGDTSGGSSEPPELGLIQELESEDVRLLKEVRPIYPPHARQNHVMGEVRVEITCAASGEVISVRWLSGNRIFHDAVMSAVRETLFAPQNTAFRFIRPYRFGLK